MPRRPRCTPTSPPRTTWSRRTWRGCRNGPVPGSTQTLPLRRTIPAPGSSPCSSHLNGGAAPLNSAGAPSAMRRANSPDVRRCAPPRSPNTAPGSTASSTGWPEPPATPTPPCSPAPSSSSWMARRAPRRSITPRMPCRSLGAPWSGSSPSAERGRGSAGAPPCRASADGNDVGAPEGRSVAPGTPLVPRPPSRTSPRRRHLHPIPSPLFRHVQRRVRLDGEVVHGVARRRDPGHPERRGQPPRRALIAESSLGERHPDPLGDLGPALQRGPRRPDVELLPAHPGRGVAPADQVLEDPREMDQRGIPRGMAEGVVQGLEAVEVAGDEGPFGGPPMLADHPHDLLEPAPVEEPGEGISARHGAL